jgi:hypothetical protein
MNAVKLFALLSGMIFLEGAANACGVCVEDKIAAVYDHASVTRALGQGHAVVYFAIDGPLKAGQATRLRIEKSAASAPGVDASSVRVSVELASLGLAFDPKRATLVQVQAHVEGKLRAMGLSLLEMRMMDRPADLAVAGRR